MNKFKIYKELIDIDYYVYFTKAYFAYNAYLKAMYPNDSDVDKNKKLKDNQRIKNKFHELINNSNNFSDNIILLRDNIGRASIENNGEIINLDSVKIGEHTEQVLFDEKYNRVDYFIKALNGDKFTFTVAGTQSTPFLFVELRTELERVNITSAQQNKIRAIITEHVQKYTINLSEEIGKLNNLDSLQSEEIDALIDNLYKGIIEIMYKLRNSLFHSEAEPNNDVMKVYKFAYFILRKMVNSIPT